MEDRDAYLAGFAARARHIAADHAHLGPFKARVWGRFALTAAWGMDHSLPRVCGDTDAILVAFGF